MLVATPCLLLELASCYLLLAATDYLLLLLQVLPLGRRNRWFDINICKMLHLLAAPTC